MRQAGAVTLHHSNYPTPPTFTGPPPVLSIQGSPPVLSIQGPPPKFSRSRAGLFSQVLSIQGRALLSSSLDPGQGSSLKFSRSRAGLFSQVLSIQSRALLSSSLDPEQGSSLKFSRFRAGLFSSPEKNPFKHQGWVHNTPLVPYYWQATKGSLGLPSPIRVNTQKYSRTDCTKSAIILVHHSTCVLLFHSLDTGRGDRILFRQASPIVNGAGSLFTIMTVWLGVSTCPSSNNEQWPHGHVHWSFNIWLKP
ncbi:hypothetical protein TNCV_3230301 [Trichonephila clavipes]|nr:hypothetical protein TNCV_3230301 [Trichonephila clavipes]